MRAACSSEVRVSPSLTRYITYPLRLTPSVDGCGIQGWPQHPASSPGSLFLEYGSTTVRAILSPVALGGLRLGGEELKGSRDRQSLTLDGTISVRDEAGCLLRWQVSLLGQLTPGQIEGQVSYRLESDGLASGCGMPASCIAVVLLLGRLPHGEEEEDDPTDEPQRE